jgi:glycosyltransferase involved in cell wall biosynthesis
MNSISFITPSRNNLKYLKWSYNSIRKNLGYRHELCWADDASTDGTWEWMVETAEKDQSIKLYRNEGPERLGHTILYDTLVNECATNDIVMIYHADMYACPKLDIEIMKHIDKGVVVSLTRIEPPLHPPGPEKILVDYGIEPEEFDEFKFLREIESLKEDRTTEGIFAPWAIYKEDFQSINGHDPLYAPQSKEDSDIFNRFVLNDYKLVQTWKGFVYHMSCRGSRFKDGAKRNPDGQVFMKGRESSEWLEQNIRSTRNFIRKWGHMVKHDELMKPIIPPKYDVGFRVYNCDENLLRELEPWCSTLYTDLEWTIYHNYIEFEQPNTLYDLRSKLKGILDPVNDVIVEFDAKKLTQGNFQFIVNLSEILADSGETGKMEYEIFKVDIKKLKNYNKELILAK